MFLAAGSTVLITAIMFLQLIFLIISVWLFCKCWYISWTLVFGTALQEKSCTFGFLEHATLTEEV